MTWKIHMSQLSILRVPNNETQIKAKMAHSVCVPLV